MRKQPHSPSPIRPVSSGKWTSRTSKHIHILQSVDLNALPWLMHGFSTRTGGVSVLHDEKVLNLGFTDWDNRENVLENRRRFQSVLGASQMHLVPLKQFHSDIICVFKTPPAEPCRTDAYRTDAYRTDANRGDASATNHPGLLLGIQTADCVPILLVDPKKHAVAAVHAGWRGTLARIVQKSAGRMRMEFGSKPQDLLAALGPAIGGCCYQVGTEVASAFATKFADAENYFDELRTGDEPNPVQWLNQLPPGHQPPPPCVLLDLRKANRAQLFEAGLREKNIFVSNLCTACHTNQLFSYRKEGAESGRLMSVIGVRDSSDPRSTKRLLSS
jgi:YfiH family protein